MRPLLAIFVSALLLLVGGALGCGSEAPEVASTDTTRTAPPGIVGEAPEDEPGEPENVGETPGDEGGPVGLDGGTCGELAKTVDGFSRKDLPQGSELVQLRLLQRDCPADAKRIGVADAELPQCERLSQPNCTFYTEPNP